MSERDRDDLPELPDEGLETSNVFPIHDLDREIARRIRHAQGLSEDEHLLNLQDKDTKRKIKIVGTAAGILIATGLLAAAGYYAAQKRKKR